MGWFGIIVGAIALMATVYFLQKDSYGCGCCCAGKKPEPSLDDLPSNDVTDVSAEAGHVAAPDPQRCNQCKMASGCALFSGTTLYKSCSGLAITFPQNCPMAEENVENEK